MQWSWWSLSLHLQNFCKGVSPGVCTYGLTVNMKRKKEHFSGLRRKGYSPIIWKVETMVDGRVIISTPRKINLFEGV